MLKVEKLICTNPKFHKDCYWKQVPLTYPDTRYLLLKDRLIRETKLTNTAYRILHPQFGVLTTVKLGHDNFIYISDNDDSLKRFALIPANKF